MTDTIRLNKFVAQSGLCTRREAAHRIKGGLIKVNGEIVKDPALQIKLSDSVTFGKKVLHLKVHHVYVLMNKPKNTWSIMESKDGEKTLLKVLGGKVTETIQPIAPMSKNDTGLLLLTSDEDLIQKVSKSDNTTEVVYHITLDKKLTPDHLNKLLTTDYKTPPFITAINVAQGKEWDEIEVDFSGCQYDIAKKYFEDFGYGILRMDRLYFHGLTKKDLSRDRFRHLTEKEIIMIKHFK